METRRRLTRKAHQSVAEALNDPEERFRVLVDNVRDYALFMLDPQGRVSSWNVGAERLKGYQPDEILGRHFSCFYTAADVARGLPDEVLRYQLLIRLSAPVSG